MKFIITGSGGCVCTPKPLCQCTVCTQAREKGYPYARCGCSLYVEDISLLVDTPEDIAIALNNARSSAAKRALTIIQPLKINTIAFSLPLTG